MTSSSLSYGPVGLFGASDRHPGGNIGFGNKLEACLNLPTTVPLQRWSVDELHDPMGVLYSGVPVRLSSFVDDIADFDNHIFRLAPAEAGAMDPQLRQLLEHSLMSVKQGETSHGKLFSTKTGRVVFLTGHTRARFWCTLPMHCLVTPCSPRAYLLPRTITQVFMLAVCSMSISKSK